MFLQEEIIPDSRPFMAVHAPEHPFLLKYFDRCFDMRITDKPDMVETPSIAFVVLRVDSDLTDETHRFIDKCKKCGLPVVTLRVPPVIGTGMDGIPMRLARGVARGTMMKIKDNGAVWSLIHATDVAKAAKAVTGDAKSENTFVIAADPIQVNDFIEALGHRIKDKRVATISPRWARILYGRKLYDILTTDKIIDTSAFKAAFPDFEFVNPAEYLTSHVYDDESL